MSERAQQLEAEGVAEVAPDDRVEPLLEELEIETSTPKAVLFRYTGDDAAKAEAMKADLDDGKGQWLPKSVLRVDAPEVYVLTKFVDDKNLWHVVA